MKDLVAQVDLEIIDMEEMEEVLYGFQQLIQYNFYLVKF